MTLLFHPGLALRDYQPDDDRTATDRVAIGVIVALWSPELSVHAATTMHELITVTVATLRRLGAHPVVIDASAPDQQAQGTAWHTGLAGFIYLGGADVHPGFYADVSLEKPYPGVDPAADDFCLTSLRRAIDADAPVLTICRGTQLLNVALGGTLHQHIDGHRADLADGNTGFVNESLTLHKQSIIANILGRSRVVVRGSHHQSIETLGTRLWVTAQAPDGTIEGVEHRQKNWVVGLQWHPEEAHANAADRQRIFGALIAQHNTAV